MIISVLPSFYFINRLLVVLTEGLACRDVANKPPVKDLPNSRRILDDHEAAVPAALP
jgi:hypothetical protein